MFLPFTFSDHGKLRDIHDMNKRTGIMLGLLYAGIWFEFRAVTIIVAYVFHGFIGKYEDSAEGCNTPPSPTHLHQKTNNRIQMEQSDVQTENKSDKSYELTFGRHQEPIFRNFLDLTDSSRWVRFMGR
jgi:hypothetical protein